MPSKIKNDNTFFVLLNVDHELDAFFAWQDDSHAECNYCGKAGDGRSMYWIRGEAEATMAKLLWG